MLTASSMRYWGSYGHQHLSSRLSSLCAPSLYLAACRAQATRNRTPDAMNRATNPFCLSFPSATAPSAEMAHTAISRILNFSNATPPFPRGARVSSPKMIHLASSALIRSVVIHSTGSSFQTASASPQRVLVPLKHFIGFTAYKGVFCIEEVIGQLLQRFSPAISRNSSSVFPL